ncbi:nSTAND1 domain-containing NTPase [Paraburkholderia terrae]
MDTCRDAGAKLSTGPYPGLRPFRHDETDIFFGREEQADQLLEKLQRSHFIAVVGPSGCGKSSLVRAGMIAALEAGFLADAGAGWRIADMRPGDRPIARLAEALLEPGALGPERGDDASERAVLQTMLRRGPLGLVEILRETRLSEGENLLVLVDQFEELFRFREQGNADDADAFVDLLLTSAGQRELPVYVVITMRSDFLGECALFLGLPEAINESQYLTPRLSREQIRSAIAGPARVFGGEVEPELVNRLLNEIGPDPDQLPLLQHALMRMWTRVSERGAANPSSADAHVLTTADYMAVGALSEALSSHADQVLYSLSERQQEIVRIMMSRLTERGVGKRDIRHPARVDDIADVAGVSQHDVITVAEDLRQQDRSFLTPSPPAPIDGHTVLDIGHESLIRQWGTLYKWVEQEAASAAMYRRLLETAHLHHDGRAALWISPDLDEALKWRKERTPTLPWALRYGSREDFELAMSFLDASEQNAILVREKGEADARREQEQRLARRRYRRIIWASIGLGALSIATGWLALWAVQQRNDAVEKRAETDVQRAVAESNARKALTAQKDAEEQKRQADLARKEAEIDRISAQEASKRANTAAAYAHEQERWALDAQAEAEAQRKKAESFARVARSREIATYAFGQTQKKGDPELALILALEAERAGHTPQSDGALQQAAMVSKLRFHTTGPAADARLLANGQFVLFRSPSKTERATMEIFRVSPEARPIATTAAAGVALSTSADGEYLAERDKAGTLTLVRVSTGKSVPVPQDARSNDFSPDGKLIAVVTPGNKLRVWQVEPLQAMQSGDDFAIDSRSPRFTPDSKTVLVGEEGGPVRVLDARTGRVLSMFGDKFTSLGNATFSPDGARVVTISKSGVATVWLVNTGERLVTIGDTDSPVQQASFTPDSMWLLTWAKSGGPVLLRPLNGQGKDVPIIHPNFENIGKLTFSADGRQMLVVADGRAWLWESVREAPRELTGSEGSGHSGSVWTANFSRDGRWIVTVSIDDGTARLWNAHTGEVVGSYAGGGVTRALISDDSRWFVTWSRDGVVRVWDGVDLGTERALSKVPKAGKWNVRAPNHDSLSAFSPDGRYLLAVDAEGRAQVWDAGTGALRARLSDGDHKTDRAFFSPTGARVITLDTDRIARVWAVQDGKEIATVGPFEGTLISGMFTDDNHVWTETSLGGSFRFELRSLADVNTVTSVKEIRVAHNCASMSPDSRWLVLCVVGKGDEANSLQVYDFPAKGQTEPLPLTNGHTGAVKDVFFSRDGHYAISAGSDGVARVWDTQTWQSRVKLTGHDGAVRGVWFSRDGKSVVTVDSQSRVRIFERDTGRQVTTYDPRGHTDLVWAAAFSPNGRWLATGGDDHSVRVWDTTTGQSVAAFYGQSGKVFAVAFGQAADTVMAAGEDGAMRVYRCEACVPTSELMMSSQKRINAIGRALSDSEKQKFLQ